MAKFKLSKAEVEHVAKLAQLKLTPQEISKFQKQLSEILEYVGQLNQLNTEKVKPTSQVTGLKNVFREDTARPSLKQSEALSAAKQKKEGLFKTKALF